MKQFIILIFSILFLTSACERKQSSVSGSGNAVRDTLTPGDFTEIENNSTFNVMVTQSGISSVIVETDDNVIPFVDISVVKKRMMIRIKNNVQLKQMTKSNIIISAKTLSYFMNNGTGNLTISGMQNLQDFILENNSTGNTNMKFSCHNLSIKNNGTGNLKFSGDCHNLSLYNSATGNVHIKGTLNEQMRVDNNGTGNINLSGKAAVFKLNNSGTGNVEAHSLIADEVEVFNYGTGNVSVYAENKLSITSAATGDVRYKGNATNKELKDLGTGSITEQ